MSSHYYWPKNISNIENLHYHVSVMLSHLSDLKCECFMVVIKSYSNVLVSIDIHSYKPALLAIILYINQALTKATFSYAYKCF